MTETQDHRGRIVVGVDGSEHSKLALRWAARVAAAEGARIDAVTAWHYPTYAGYAGVPEDYTPKEEFERMLADTVDDVFGTDRPADMRLLTVQGGAAAVLLDAGKDAVMLVVGSRGHGGFMGLLLGSVSSKVAEHATCPVLVVHRQESATDAPS